MKTLFIIRVALIALAPGLVAGARAQLPFNSGVTLEGTEIELSWNAIPGNLYEVLVATNLDKRWVQLDDQPVLSPFNFASIRTPAAGTNRFFQVKQVDTQPPVVVATSPADRGVAVTRRGQIGVTIYDDGVIDTNSLKIVITNGPPIRLSDARLSFTEGLLLFAPLPGEVLGDFGQTIRVTVSAADLSGNRFDDYAWTFQLEQEPIISANVVLVDNTPPGLVLLSTNPAGTTFVFRFTGAGSGLVPGTVVVGVDPSFLYRRTVLTVSEDQVDRTVTVTTAAAPLSSSYQQASVQFDESFGGTSFQPEGGGGAGADGGGGFALASVGGCCTIPLDGRTLISTPSITASVSTGRFELDPRVALRGNFGPSGLQAADLEIQEALKLDVTFRATALTAGAFTNRIALGSARQRLPVDFAGSVPAWVDAQIEFFLGFESLWERPGTVRGGILSTNLIAVTSRLRSGGWTNEVSRIVRYQVPTPVWETNLTASVQVYVEVILTLNPENVAGPQLRTRPSVEVAGTTAAPPGHAGFDVFVVEGFSSVLSLDLRGWDAGAPVLGSIRLIDAFAPVSHHRQVIPVRVPAGGPRVRPRADMVWIPPGHFVMGQAGAPSPPQVCDCPPTPVGLNEGFHIARFEVRQREFLDVMGTNAAFHHEEIWGINLDRPVENVTWHEATNYCRQLTVRERQAGHIPINYAYRLPTEAEWEYACQSRTTNRFHYGAELPSGWANYDCRLRLFDACAVNPVLTAVTPSTSLDPQPISVGRFAPNWWGLHDMHGNVAEWCVDWLGDALPGVPLIDPRGETNGPLRAVRGGNFRDNDLACRSSARVGLLPSVARDNVGFRVVLAAGAPPELEGYQLQLFPGYNLIANHLDRGSNNINDVLRFLPSDSLFQKWDPLLQSPGDIALYDGNTWLDGATGDPSSLTLSPGEGGFVYIPGGSPILTFFSGYRRQTITFPNLVPGAYTFLSRQVPEPGNYETIVGRAPIEGAQVYRFVTTNNNYSVSIYTNGTWNPSPPTARIGEAWVVEVPAGTMQ